MSMRFSGGNKQASCLLPPAILVEKEFIPIRLIKYNIDGNKYMLATTHINCPLKKIKDMYKLRWRVEISFKRLKSYLNLNKIFSLSENFWKQEMQLRILLDSLIRISQVKIKSKIQQCNTKKIRQTYKTKRKVVRFVPHKTQASCFLWGKSMKCIFLNSSFYYF